MWQNCIDIWLIQAGIQSIGVEVGMLDEGGDFMEREIDLFITLARHGDVEQVKKWLHSGVNPNARDVYGSTALIEAAKRGKTEILRVLLRYGADKEIRDGRGITALMGASYNAQIDAVALLLKAGALPNVQDECGNTSLHWVVGDDKQIILEERRALDTADERWRQDIQSDWRLSVHSARSAEVVKLLLKSGADVHICNYKGETALDLLSALENCPSYLTEEQILQWKESQQFLQEIRRMLLRERALYRMGEQD